MASRRELLLLTSAVAGTVSLRGQAAATQLFRAGVCIGGQNREAFWKNCDECSQVGFHDIESSGVGIRLVDVYGPNPGQLKEELIKRQLTLIGYAHYSPMADPAKRDDLISLHLRIGRTLQPIGRS